MNDCKVRLGTCVGLALTVLLWLAGPVSTVQANGCSAVSGTPPPSITERTTAAPIVFEGSVTAVSGTDLNSTASVQVFQYLKGSGPALVHIGGFHKEHTLYECRDWVSIGDHLMFYADRDTESGRLYRFVVGAQGSTIPADSASLAEGMAAAGQLPVTPFPVTEAPPSTSTSMTATATPSVSSTPPAPLRASSRLVILFLTMSGLTGTAAILLLLRSVYARSKKRT